MLDSKEYQTDELILEDWKKSEVLEKMVLVPLLKDKYFSKLSSH